MVKPDPLQNRHPADRLRDIRDEIKRLKADEDFIRRMMLEGKFDLIGDEVEAVIQAGTQKRLDRDALAEVVNLSEFMKSVEVTTIKVKDREASR